MVGGGSPPGRRRFLRLTLGLAAAGGVILQLIRNRMTTRPRLPKLSVLAECVGCTGCAGLCPTSAIAVIPGGIAVDDEKCTQCGYCVTACPVGGVRVNQFRDDG